MLTGPLFMLQVYDRVLASRSIPTLVALLVLIIVLYTGMAVFEFIRARVLSRIAHGVDANVAPELFQYWLQKSAGGVTPGYRPLTDLGALRSFLASPSLVALYDLPWSPLRMLHQPVMGFIFVCPSFLGG